MNNVLIIGSGIAGLSAAALLAKRGIRATVLERAAHLGGRARTSRADGYAFNLGAHALYRGLETEGILRELNVPYRAPKAPAAGAIAIMDDPATGRLEPLPGGPISMMSTGALSTGSKLQLSRQLGKLMAGHPSGLAGKTVSQWLSTLGAPDLQRLTAALVRVSTYANAPDQLCADRAARQVRAALKNGVGYVDGGWQTLVDGLAERARTLGAALKTQQSVKRIEKTEHGFVVRTASHTFEAGSVILATPPKIAADLLGETSPSLSSDLRALTPIYAQTLDVALADFDPGRVRFALGIEEPLYYSVHSRTAKLAPKGSALIHAAYYLPPDADPDPAPRRAKLEAMLARFCPGWERSAVRVQHLPKIAVSHGMPIAGQKLPAHAQLPGLFLAGDWVGDQGMLADAASASARAATEAIIARQRAAA